jgi:hypothetical protein
LSTVVLTTADEKFGGQQMSTNSDDKSNNPNSKRARKAQAQKKKEYEAQREERLLELFAQFNKEYPTEGACLRALCQGNDYPDGLLKCPYCQILQVPGDLEARKTKCLNCNREIWVTAQGTFRNSRKPRAWLAYAWLMDHGMIINPNRFHLLLEIAASTAANIFKTITVGRLPVLDALKDNIESAVFKDLYIRRSIETPAQSHPVTEQNVVDRADPQEAEAFHENMTSSEPPDKQKSPDNAAKSAASTTFSKKQKNSEALSMRERMIFEKLSKEPLHIDRICEMVPLEPRLVSAILTTLELKGVARRLPGDRYAIAEKPQSQAFETKDRSSFNANVNENINKALLVSINMFHDFIYLTFQGISRKYLELYLACFSIELTDVENGRGVIESLRSTGPIPQKIIMEHFTPRLVRIPLAVS